MPDNDRRYFRICPHPNWYVDVDAKRVFRRKRVRMIGYNRSLGGPDTIDLWAGDAYRSALLGVRSDTSTDAVRDRTARGNRAITVRIEAVPVREVARR